MDSRALSTANADLLQQLLRLLPDLSDEQYRSQLAHCMEGTIGQHVRHLIDHYQCFVVALRSKNLDYSLRQRDVNLESDREFACMKIGELIATLETLKVLGSEQIEVLHEPIANGSRPATSSVARELEFLLSHTIHHYALIAIALRLLGKAVPENFGIAFSTVNYRSGLSAQRAG